MANACIFTYLVHSYGLSEGIRECMCVCGSMGQHATIWDARQLNSLLKVVNDGSSRFIRSISTISRTILTIYFQNWEYFGESTIPHIQNQKIASMTGWKQSMTGWYQSMTGANFSWLFHDKKFALHVEAVVCKYAFIFLHELCCIFEYFFLNICVNSLHV